MNIKCPHCGTEYDAEESEYGKFVKCEVCGKGFVAGEQEQCHCCEEKYICTNCGEKSTSSKQTWLGLLGCFGVIMAFVGGGFFGMIHPLIGIAVFIVMIVSSIVHLVRAGKTYCKKCGKYDTLILTSCPQGVRLLKAFGHLDDTPNSPQPNTKVVQQSITERLEQTRRLLESGLISEAEYEAKRRRILDSL